MELLFRWTPRRRLGPVLALVAVLSLTASVNTARAAGEIAVTTTAPGIDVDDACSLQEAIFAANLDSSVVPSQNRRGRIDQTACTAGNGADTIVLPAGGSFA